MSIRITVKAADAEAATEFKERYFKQLYNHAGDTVIFEVPEGDALEEEITKAAKEAGHDVSSETYQDPLEDAEPVDFW